MMAGDVYRRSATIHAVQWFNLGDHPGVILRKRWPEPRDECSVFWLGALSGGFVVRPGDWIVTDELGRQSPMEPEKFAATYELAGPTSHQGTNPMTQHQAPEVTGEMAALKEQNDG